MNTIEFVEIQQMVEMEEEEEEDAEESQVENKVVETEDEDNADEEQEDFVNEETPEEIEVGDKTEYFSRFVEFIVDESDQQGIEKNRDVTYGKASEKANALPGTSCNEEAITTLRTLIVEDWKLEISTYQLLKGLGISTVDLKEMSKEDIEEIFASDRTGEKIRFRSKLRNWTESVLYQRPQEGCSNRLNFSKSHVCAKDLDKLLQTNEKGKIITKYYEKHNSLNSLLRKQLSEIICDSYISQEKSFPICDMQMFSEFISLKYPSESRETYFCARDSKIKKVNPSGLLYYRYYNSRERKLLMPQRPRKRKIDGRDDIEYPSPSQYSEADIAKLEEDRAWLANNNMPLEDVKTRWLRTCQYRLNLISSLKFSQILEQWPRYLDAEGLSYLDVDYAHYQGNENGLFLGWPTFASKMLEHAETIRAPRDKSFLGMIEKLQRPELSACSRNFLVYKLFPSIFKPKRISKNVLPSILQAQKDSLIHCVTANDIGPTIEALKKLNDELQPVIIVVGSEDSNVTQFYVVKGKLFWKACSFLKCIDIVVKSCAVFGLQYSPYNELFWVFIRTYFMKEDNVKHSKSSALITLEKILKQ